MWKDRLTKRFSGWQYSVLAGVCLGLLVQGWTQQAFSIHPSGWQYSEANAIENGQAGGGGIQANGSMTAVFWSSLDSSAATVLNQSTAGSWAFAMSNGVLVGPAWNDTVHAGAWTPSFIDLNPSFTAWSNAFSVAQAQASIIAGIALYNTVFHAVVWGAPNPNTLYDLHPAGATQSFAYGINHQGQVVGTVDDQAAYWSSYTDASSYVNLHPAGASQSQALAIAPNGQVGGYAVFGGVEHAYLWDPSTNSAKDIHPTGATGHSEVLGITSSASGITVPVGFAHFNGEQHAVVWRCLDASGYVDLHAALPAGYTFSWARGVWIDSDGTIYISGAAGNDTVTEAYVWVLIPADVNGDGCVDDSDLLAVLFSFGNTGGCNPSDLNGDGTVDDSDLLMVLFAFGSGC